MPGMSDLLSAMKPAAKVLARAGVEARYAATLLHARGAGVAAVPPHRMLPVLRALDAYGPVGASLALAVAAQPDFPALIDEQGPVSAAELDRSSNELANALLARGLHAGDSIGILARNHRGIFEAIFAGAKVGARTLLLNTDFAKPQLADVCEREDVAVIVHDPEFADVVSGYDPPLGRVLARVDEDGSGSGKTGDTETLESVRAEADPSVPPRPQRKQRIVLLTSGTTGTPKGAARDLGLSMAVPGGYLSKIPLRSGRTVFLAAPAFHAWGLLSAMLAMGLGNTVVVTRKFDPAFTVAALEHHRCDALITVPILLSRLLALGDDKIRAHDLSALRIVAVSGSALDPALAEHTMDLLGDVVYNLYGSTEVAYAAIATPADLRAAPGTVGRPPFGTVVKILDDNNRPMPTGTTGRIFVGNSIQFEGYTGGGNKDVVDGLMSTGDVGHLDDSGRLFVEGRDDDMIVSGGENVFPREIEELLAAHDGIDEAAVVGVDDPDYGKRLRAYVVRAAGATLDEGEVRDYVKSNLARYKVPREVVFLDGLPRNPAGKVVKRELPDPESS